MKFYLLLLDFFSLLQKLHEIVLKIVWKFIKFLFCALPKKIIYFENFIYAYFEFFRKATNIYKFHQIKLNKNISWNHLFA